MRKCKEILRKLTAEVECAQDEGVFENYSYNQLLEKALKEAADYLEREKIQKSA